MQPPALYGQNRNIRPCIKPSTMLTNGARPLARTGANQRCSSPIDPKRMFARARGSENSVVPHREQRGPDFLGSRVSRRRPAAGGEQDRSKAASGPPPIDWEPLVAHRRSRTGKSKKSSSSYLYSRDTFLVRSRTSQPREGHRHAARDRHRPTSREPSEGEHLRLASGISVKCHIGLTNWNYETYRSRLVSAYCNMLAFDVKFAQ